MRLSGWVGIAVLVFGMPAGRAQAPAAKPAASAPKPSQTAPATPAPKAAQAVPATPPPPPPIPSPQPPFPNIPAAQLSWATVVDAAAPAPLLPETDADRLRHAAISGGRAIVLFESSPQSNHGGRPLAVYRLASLELTTGKILVQRDLPGPSRPALFATDDDHMILQQATLSRLNPDLSESGEQFGDPLHTAGWRDFLLSPDGSTMAFFLNSSTRFLDTHTLQAFAGRIENPEPAAISKKWLLSTAPVWNHQFPQDTSFIALYGGRSPYLLYHGPCAGHPVFLDEQRILTVACAKVTIYELSGKVMKELPLGAAYGAFAGLSRDGSRFAIESSDYSVTDPAFSATELFTIYDAQSYAPVATVTPDSLPDARSWAAFSQDGKSFLTGSARKVSLYKIP
jgi:hypothetical protein